MGKFNSYYDWESSFKKKPKSQKGKKKKKADKIVHEPLGIKEKIWKEYISSWKKKNLP